MLFLCYQECFRAAVETVLVRKRRLQSPDMPLENNHHYEVQMSTFLARSIECVPGTVYATLIGFITVVRYTQQNCHH